MLFSYLSIYDVQFVTMFPTKLTLMLTKCFQFAMNSGNERKCLNYSGNIRKNLKTLKIHFNEEAVVTLTSRKIPIQLKFVASLGKTFNYCQEIDDSTAIDIFVSMNKIISKCNVYEELFHVKRRFNGMTEKILDGSLEKESPTEAQSYIRQLMLQAVEFLTKNQNVVVISSDKGGKTVIMERMEYFNKMHEYLEENITLGNYERENGKTLLSIQKKVELSYAETITHINPFLLTDKKLSSPLTPEPYLIPLLYGGPKIHKEHIPMRPIVSSTDMIGQFLSGWLLEKLQLIAISLNKYNVSNSKNLVLELNEFKMEPGHKLCSFDYVSMFTNVEVEETFKIILELYDVVKATTTVPANVFIDCLKFFTDYSTFFMFNGFLFKQVKGLAMGNRLAQILAEIRTNYALNKSLKEYDAEIISFFYKYVDDIFTSIKEDCINIIKEKISKFVGMELTITEENKDFEVEFLDCVFRRNNNFSVSSRWMKKKYSSKSILNFHSNHQISTKKNVIIEMINHAFAVTSPVFHDETKALLTDVLRRSSYPEAIIKSYVKPFDNAVHPRILKSPPCFVSCPYSNPSFNNIKSVIHRNRLCVKIAPKPTSNNRRMLFSKIKDTRRTLSKKNSIFQVRCNSCLFKHTCTTGNWDIRRAYERIMNDQRSPCKKHILDFPEHSMNKKVSIIKSFYNKYDTEHSRYIFKHIGTLKGRRIMIG